MIKNIYGLLRKIYSFTKIEKVPFVHKLINVYIGGTIVDFFGVLRGFRFKRSDNLGYKIIMLFNMYEPKTFAAYKELIKPGMKIVDIGASIGYHTAYFSRNAGEKGYVYAFEPEPENFRILCRNISKFKFKNTVPVEKAASDSNGTVKFYKTELSALGSLNKPGGNATEIEIETVTGDDYFNGKSDIDFVKIDAEGAETKVLNGMAGMLKQSNGIKIMLEVNPEALKSAGSSEQELKGLISSFGFKTKVIEEYPEGSYNILCFRS